MGNNFLNFLKYNNAVPIGVAVLLLSTSGALAASPEIRADIVNAVLTSEQTVKTVDNSYIVNIDLTNFAPKIQITGVTEDSDNYYVSYSISTIDIKDYVWQDILKEKQMEVGKASLRGQDLGLRVTQILRNVNSNEIAYLLQVQGIERKTGIQLATVATVYSGLIGKFLDPKEETLPGYVPVIAPPESEQEKHSVATSVALQGGAGGHTPSSSTGALQILGKNPAQIPVGSSYMDLGAAIVDMASANLGYKTEGADNLDTTKPRKYIITYTLVSLSGQISVATRTVIVYDPAIGPPIDPSTIIVPNIALPPPDVTATPLSPIDTDPIVTIPTTPFTIASSTPIFNIQTTVPDVIITPETSATSTIVTTNATTTP